MPCLGGPPEKNQEFSPVAAIRWAPSLETIQHRAFVAAVAALMKLNRA